MAGARCSGQRPVRSTRSGRTARDVSNLRCAAIVSRIEQHHTVVLEADRSMAYWPQPRISALNSL
jgi:hypothetical protein